MHSSFLRELCMPKVDLAAVPLRKGSGYRAPLDAPCASRDMKSANSDGRFVHKDGTPYPTSR